MNGLFISELARNPEYYIVTVVLVVFSICVHEASHTCVARMCGDSTAWDGGYMTLNPLKLMGIPSLIMLVLCGISWGMVPVNPDRLRPQWRRGLVSLAGPAANVALAVVFAGSLALYAVCCTFMPALKEGAMTNSINLLLQRGLELNLLLAIFNMIPVPPLDGWDVFATIIPPLTRVSHEIRNAGMAILFILLFATKASMYLFLPAAIATELVSYLLGMESYRHLLQQYCTSCI